MDCIARQDSPLRPTTAPLMTAHTMLVLNLLSRHHCATVTFLRSSSFKNPARNGASLSSFTPSRLTKMERL